MYQQSVDDIIASGPLCQACHPFLTSTEPDWKLHVIRGARAHAATAAAALKTDMVHIKTVKLQTKPLNVEFNSLTVAPLTSIYLSHIY